MTFSITPISGARNVKSQGSQKRDQLENMAQQVIALATKPDDLTLIPGTPTMKGRWQLPKIVSGFRMSTIACAHAHEHRHTKINKRFGLEKGINGCLPYHARWPEFNPPDPHTEREGTNFHKFYSDPRVYCVLCVPTYTCINTQTCTSR